MKSNYLIYIILFFSILSCVKSEKIEDFPIDKPRLVVNCVFENNKKFFFYLSKSLSSIDNAVLKTIKVAEIKLYENDILIETITKSKDTTIHSDVIPVFISLSNAKAGNTYKIIVSSPNLETVSAESKLSDSKSIFEAKISTLDTSIYAKSIIKGDSVKYHLSFDKLILDVTINDPKNEENYYKISFVNKYISWHEVYEKYVNVWHNIYIDNPESIDLEIYGSSCYIIDKYINGTKHTYPFNFKKFTLNTSSKDINFYIDVESLSPALYQYDLSLSRMNQSLSNPFVEPSQVYTNIVNGYGIFACKSKHTIIL